MEPRPLWRRALKTAMALTAGVMIAGAAPPGAGQRVYVGEFGQNSVGVIDAATGTVLRHIGLPAGVHGVGILPDGSRIFVSSDASSIISVIDSRTDEIIGKIPTGRQPHGLAVAADGRRVFACVFGDDQVLEIDPVTHAVLRTFDVPAPHNLAPAPDGTALFVASQKPEKTGIGRINLKSGRLEAFLPTGTIPRSLNLSPDGGTLVATLFDRNEVQFYSPRTLKLLRAVTVGGAPHHVLFTNDGKHVLVVDQTTNDMTVIDASTFAVSRTIPVGKKPHWIAPTGDSRYAYVSDEGSNQVSLVDLEDGDVERTIPVGGAPRKLVLGAVSQPDRAPAVQGATGDAATPAPAGKRVTVNIQGPPPRFVPETITIDAGTTVEWVNGGHGVHTVTDGGGAWDSGSLAPGERFTRTFDSTGTFPYYCIPHHAMGMTGTIIVR
ncbi:MAG TPA: plastocyanin/azurin family copper-binding protein [Bacteroidota bacterium]|nr:plastocyanin/azurin family copper-binding protein [Bacteroidota bacterium]